MDTLDVTSLLSSMMAADDLFAGFKRAWPAMEFSNGTSLEEKLSRSYPEAAVDKVRHLLTMHRKASGTNPLIETTWRL